MTTVGQSVPRIDGIDKVTGRAAYVGDLEVPGMVHGKVLRSPLPHAKVISIDATRAERLSGVIAVLTRDKLHGIDPFFGSVIRDRPIVAMDKVRYQGEPVAAVAALDLATAQEALELIQVDYEELPLVADTEHALDAGAALVHASNICHQQSYDWGDVDAGFAQSDRVFEDTFTFPMVYHYALEPHASIGQYTSQGITVWSTAQHPFMVRDDLARMFGFSLNQVRIIVPYLGGGFGSKSYTKLEPLAVALSKVAERPVRVALSVEEAFKTVRRHSARCTVKTGVKRDGTFVARQCWVYLDTGAYADNGPLVAGRAGERIAGPYRWPSIKVDSYAIYTNTTPAGSFRSIGAPQAAWASESQIDIIAAELGIDPLELRLKNLVARGEEVRKGQRPLEGNPAEGLRLAAQAVGWDSPEPAADPTDAVSPLEATVSTGKGLGCNLSGVGSSPTSTALVRLHVDGSVTVLAGTTELGQGSKSVLAQVASEELGIPLERIAVVSSDTSIVPYDRSTGSSRSTTLMGLAVQDGAREVKEQLLELAVRHFESPPEELVLEQGRVLRQGEGVTFGELIEEEFGGVAGELLGRGYVTPRRHGGRLAQSPVFWEVGIAAAQVEVDEETGAIRVRHYVSVADVGKAINPQQCEGQDEGAAMQGLGHTLFEEMLYEDGQLLNPNLIDYHVPTFAELPDKLETILIENGDGPGPFGAKGLGEGGIVAAAPAVANAIFRATGVRIKDLPLTPERVWRALQRAKRQDR
ncbi:MAG: xanthine dehydrogenase family protein molybdopterin-binding subunit [Chloroflexi bacterium]|nr:xanthine dehydrogenase family protein molybdopterin-binding subunit [Chloroflexota bacterium]